MNVRVRAEVTLWRIGSTRILDAVVMFFARWVWIFHRRSSALQTFTTGRRFSVHGYQSNRLAAGGSLAGNDSSQASSSDVHGLRGLSRIPSGPAGRTCTNESLGPHFAASLKAAACLSKSWVASDIAFSRKKKDEGRKAEGQSDRQPGKNRSKGQELHHHLRCVRATTMATDTRSPLPSLSGSLSHPSAFAGTGRHHLRSIRIVP